ncbi:HAD hydrolase-like protein [Kitasatospora sp. NPDC093102]|uniref:HAD family hydrolase n=1 Tax=Kitasatospora sp. NPDC093102 TaxID=3155069 RepID=UPI003444AD3A
MHTMRNRVPQGQEFRPRHAHPGRSEPGWRRVRRTWPPVGQPRSTSQKSPALQAGEQSKACSSTSTTPSSTTPARNAPASSPACTDSACCAASPTPPSSAPTSTARPNPPPGIFRAGCARLGLPPHQVAYVGDKYDLDALGARAAGLHPFWLDRTASRTPADDGIHVLHTLADLPAALHA